MEDACPKCDSPITLQVRHCATCGHDLGYPNVRLARNPVEKSALEQRFKDALRKAQIRGQDTEFREFVEAVEEHSSIVVSVPAHIALGIVQDSDSIFENYEKLVGSGSRNPAKFENDQRRRVVVGSLFPTFGENLRYGVLSLTGSGLVTYGEIFMRLRPMTVKDRSCFLEMNSYKFAKKFPEANKPEGYLCDWESRGKLAGIKVADKFKNGLKFEEWNQLLIESDDKNRENDDFIEALIYGPFNLYSIESIAIVPNLSGRKKRTASLVKETFDEMRPGD